MADGDRTRKPLGPRPPGNGPGKGPGNGPGKGPVKGPRKGPGKGPGKGKGPKQGTYLGRVGEEAAWKHLEGQGYKIVERNYRCRLGEVDLIARDGEILCFIEVKARRQGAFGGGLEAVDSRKRSQIRRVATYFLTRFGDQSPVCRFDAAEVWIGRDGRAENVIVVRNAF